MVVGKLGGWAGRHVLVTGATGFIGVRLVQRLVEVGAQVWAGVYPGESPERVASLAPEVERVPFDVQDAEGVRRVVLEAAPDVVFHLAAVGVSDTGIEPVLALAVNAGGAINLLEALRRRAVQRVVLVGTCYEYGARQAVEGLDPFNAYAASKVAAWAFGRMYWRVHGLPIVTVRPFQVYGPGQPEHMLIPSAIVAALAGQDLMATAGEQARDFIYVDDVVEGMLAAALAPGIEGESLDLGSGVARPVREVLDRVWELTGARGRILYGALPYRPGEVIHLAANAERTARLIGWCACVGLDEGLRYTIDWMRTNQLTNQP